MNTNPEYRTLGKFTPAAPGADKCAHRASRVEMYADWIAHDADGLAFNVNHPAESIDGATAILAGARAKLAWALEQIDQAIAADRAAHAATEKEPA
jgi:hypothetical protein